jgi:hypothetical protein
VPVVGGITLTAKVDGLDEIVQRLGDGLFTIAALAKTVKKYGRMAQAQAVLNVSGIAVTYSSGVFVVNRVTGKLSQSISLIQVNPLTSLVIATAKYADWIESGTRAYKRTIELKPAAERNPSGTVKKKKRRKKKIIANKGSRGTAKLLRSTATSRTWLMPARAGRPFMQAAAEKILPLFTAEVADVYAAAIEKGPAPE